MSMTLVNLILAAAVLVVGLWAYARRQSVSALLIGLAFGLFTVAHLLTLLGHAPTLNTLLIVVRSLGYLVAILAVIRLGTRS